jgi:choline dehydrogenase-like flavoprotein
MIYIVGSGLSAVATAAALVKRGYRPTILDAGLRAETDVSSLKSRLAATEPSAWTVEDRELLKRTGAAALSGVPQKLSFGSDFPYRDIDPATSIGLHNVSMRRSFAFGGFSNVWGAVIEPFSDTEFKQWPITKAELSSHYDAMRRLMCAPSDAFVNPSAQAQELYRDMMLHHKELNEHGIQFDYARLAIRSSDSAAGKGCRSCGYCLYGCPYDSIFESGAALSEFIRQGAVDYVSDVLVDRIHSVNGAIEIEARSVKTSEARLFRGHVVFLAAGLLESTRIVLRSATEEAAGVPGLKVQASQMFTVPMLRYRAVRPAPMKSLHTLCQLIMNISDESIGEYPVHLQLYGYNDLYPLLIQERLRLPANSLKPIVDAIAHRLFIAFGYLHSSLSPPIRVVADTRDKWRLSLQPDESDAARAALDTVRRKLQANRKYFRALPVTQQMKLDLPGGGFRTGGCFPMRRRPAEFETDTLGRLTKLPSVHIVDSSILPAVPAGPLAFTVMANAHRIASECPIPND